MKNDLTTLDMAIGTGQSQAEDAAVAAAEVVRSALGGRVPSESDLFVAFATNNYDMSALAVALDREARPARVVGCSAAGSFTSSGYVHPGCVGVFLPAAGSSFGIGARERLGEQVFDVAQAATEEALEEAGEELPYTAVLLLSDGLAGDQREVMRGVYSVTGATIPLVGGAAAGSAELRRTFQFAGQRVMTNGLVVVAINSPTPLGVGVRHGWRPRGESMIVTRSEGNVIWELDGRPAMERYIQQSEFSSPGEIRSSLTAMGKPLGVAGAAGGYEIREVLNGVEPGGLELFGSVGEAAVVRVMEANTERLVEAAELAASEAIAALNGPPRGALVFSCVARAALLGDAISKETAAVAAGLGRVPIGGFFTYGEFARVTGSSGFHNSTIAVLAL